jgi:hypothetical protein
MQIVSSKQLFNLPQIPINAFEIKNSQNSGDAITSRSSISFDVVPGIIASKNVNANISTELEINTSRRHLYLSVIAVIIGVVISKGIGRSVNIKPTMNAE